MSRPGDLCRSSTQSRCEAIEWLTPEREHATGEVSEAFFAQLVLLCADPWQPVASAGFHPCPFCRFTGGARSVTYRDTVVSVGSSNVFVPGEHVVYVAPSLIVHYVDAHRYRPPDAFVSAVLACPPMRSIAYLARLRALGVRRTRA